MHHRPTSSTSLASIGKALESLHARTKDLIREAGGLPSTSGPRRLSDAERARIVRQLENGDPVAQIAKANRTTRMTVYSVAHQSIPGFRQRVFHQQSSSHEVAAPQH